MTVNTAKMFTKFKSMTTCTGVTHIKKVRKI